jgi:dsDNA-binding SOS-regulon protein
MTMANVFIMPVKIDVTADKAVLVYKNLLNIWLPKSQIIMEDGYVYAMASWLYFKKKEHFKKTSFKTIEESKQYLKQEKEIEEMMENDPTLYRCEHCGCLFRSETYERLCVNCDINYSIALGKTKKFGTMSSKEKDDALVRGIIHKP